MNDDDNGKQYESHKTGWLHTAGDNMLSSGTFKVDLSFCECLINFLKIWMENASNIGRLLRIMNKKTNNKEMKVNSQN